MKSLLLFTCLVICATLCLADNYQELVNQVDGVEKFMQHSIDELKKIENKNSTKSMYVAFLNEIKAFRPTLTVLHSNLSNLLANKTSTSFESIIQIEYLIIRLKKAQDAIDVAEAITKCYNTEENYCLIMMKHVLSKVVSDYLALNKRAQIEKKISKIDALIQSVLAKHVKANKTEQEQIMANLDEIIVEANSTLNEYHNLFWDEMTKKKREILELDQIYQMEVAIDWLRYVYIYAEWYKMTIKSIIDF